MVNRLFFRLAAICGWVAILFTFLFLPLLTQRADKKSINVFLWSGVIDPKFFKEFEQKTGIKVNVTYFGGNEELIAKLLATDSKGYDLISPSDYVVDFLIKHKQLKKLDKSKLNFYDKLNPKLLGYYFDPENDYSIPQDWYVLGLGINKKYFKNGLPPASWKTVFDPAFMPKNMGLINDSRELIGLAIYYKYGQLRPINQKEQLEIKELLVNQKRYVEAYTDFRGDFLLESGNCSMVLVGSNFIWKTLVKNPDLAFLIPQEGTFLGIENYVIPFHSQKADMVYQLLNFLFEPEVQRYNFEHWSNCSPRKDADYLFENQALKEVIPFIHPDTPERALTFHNFLTDEQVDEIWLSVKGN
jgi:spermidine/putrescine transport system substrate-binding protein